VHPKRASFLIGKHLLLEDVLPPGRNSAVRPIYIFAAQKFEKTANAHEQTRTPLIGILLAETPNYLRRVGKMNDGRNRETPEILESTIFSV